MLTIGYYISQQFYVQTKTYTGMLIAGQFIIVRVETTQTSSFDNWYRYQLSFNKKRNKVLDTCYNADGLWKVMLGERSQSQKSTYSMISFMYIQNRQIYRDRKEINGSLGMQVRFLSREDTLKKEMATHSRILAWRIPRKRNLVDYGPQDHRVGHDWCNLALVTRAQGKWTKRWLLMSIKFVWG